MNEIYTWESVGDQESKIRKVCDLGPHKLEHFESGWHDETLLMASEVWLWNPKLFMYEQIASLPIVEYVRDESYKVLEDWYACNVLSEEFFTGVIHEQRDKSAGIEPIRYTRQRDGSHASTNAPISSTS